MTNTDLVELDNVVGLAWDRMGRLVCQQGQEQFLLSLDEISPHSEVTAPGQFGRLVIPLGVATLLRLV